MGQKLKIPKKAQGVWTGLYYEQQDPQRRLENPKEGSKLGFTSVGLGSLRRAAWAGGWNQEASEP